MSRPNEFTRVTKELALLRQENHCAACGEFILAIGEFGREAHYFGESAEAHHVRPISQGGTDAIRNCVIICKSCHYTAHEGGNFRFSDLRLTQSDYEYFNGKPARTKGAN